MDRNEASLPSGYRLLVEYNNYVLAEKDFEYSDSKKQYVTWFKNDRGYALGHYSFVKKIAEEDFALRTGLVDKNMLFNPDELAVIYKALNDLEAAGKYDYDNEQLCSNIESVRDKLENLSDIDIEKYSRISVLIIEPNQEPKPAEIRNDLHALQEIVGGYIEIVYPYQDDSIAVICNEEGKLRGLPQNREIDGQMYVGTIVVAGIDDDREFCSLTSVQKQVYKETLGTGEHVSKSNNVISNDIQI